MPTTSSSSSSLSSQLRYPYSSLLSNRLSPSRRYDNDDNNNHDSDELPISTSRNKKKRKNKYSGTSPCESLTTGEYSELVCIFGLMFLAILAIIFLHMGSTVTLCNKYPNIDEKDSPYYVPPLPPCLSSPVAQDIFRLRSDLLQYTSTTFAEYQQSLAAIHSSQHILKQIQIDAAESTNRWRIQSVNPKSLANPLNKLLGRPWYDVYLNNSFIPCSSMTYLGNRMVGERKYICNAYEWKKNHNNNILNQYDNKNNKPQFNTDTDYIDYNLSPPCPILSIGSNLEWEFENDVLSLLPSTEECSIYVTDCTVNPDNFVHKDNRIKPLSICIDKEYKSKPSVLAKGITNDGERIPAWTEYYDSIDNIIYNTIGYQKYQYLADQDTKKQPVTTDILYIEKEDTVPKVKKEPKPNYQENTLSPDLWKVDCEGCEFNIVLSLLMAANKRYHNSVAKNPSASITKYATSSVMNLPSQIAMEVHTTYLRQCAGDDVQWLFNALARAGYVITHREDNPSNEFVSEYTFARLYCEADTPINTNTE